MTPMKGFFQGPYCCCCCCWGCTPIRLCKSSMKRGRSHDRKGSFRGHIVVVVVVVVGVTRRLGNAKRQAKRGRSHNRNGSIGLVFFGFFGFVVSFFLCFFCFFQVKLVEPDRTVPEGNHKDRNEYFSFSFAWISSVIIVIIHCIAKKTLSS